MGIAIRDIALWIELLDIELRGDIEVRAGLPADERAWSRARLAELQARFDAMETGQGA